MPSKQMIQMSLASHKRSSAKPENVDPSAQGQSDPAALAQSSLTPGAVKHIGQTAGNGAVLQLLEQMVKGAQPAQTGSSETAPASANTPTPAMNTDLSAQAQLDDFSSEAYQFWYQNPQKTLQEFVEEMVNILSRKLVYPVTPRYTQYEVTSSGGGFYGQTFEIYIPITDYGKCDTPISYLSYDKIAKLVGVLVHEARHAQQHLSIAQMQAGQKKEAADIAKDIEILPEAAEAAKEKPLDPAKPENKTQIAEAQKWEPFMGGRYENYYNAILKMHHNIVALLHQLEDSPAGCGIAEIAMHINEIQSHFGKLIAHRGLALKDDADMQVNILSTNIEQAFYALESEYINQQSGVSQVDRGALERLATDLDNALYDAYRTVPHEKDAGAVGEAASAAFERVSVAPTDLPTGLGKRVEIDSFIYQVYKRYFQDPNKSQKEFVEEMIRVLNEKLVYPVKPTYTASDAEISGIFCPDTFEISINLREAGKYPVGALNQEEITGFVETLTREARHAEQLLRVAQMQAGQGKPADEIAKSLGIPPEIAQAAADAKNRLNDKEKKEAEKWEPFLSSAYEPYNDYLVNLRYNLDILHDQLRTSPADTVIADIATSFDQIQITTEKLVSHQDSVSLKGVGQVMWGPVIDIQRAASSFKSEYEEQKDGAKKVNKEDLMWQMLQLDKALSDALRASACEKDAQAVAGAAAGGAWRRLKANSNDSTK